MIYMFEDYELDTDLYELRQMGKALKVEPQVFDLLTYLVQHHGHICSKERLLDQLWTDQFVSDWALAYSIKAARLVVGDCGPIKRVIQTVRGRGYRFIAPVDMQSSDPTASEKQVAKRRFESSVWPALSRVADREQALPPPGSNLPDEQTKRDAAIVAPVKDAVKVSLTPHQNSLEVLQVGAVWGQSFPAIWLQELDLLDAATLRHHLDELVASGVLVPQEGPLHASFAFAQTLLYEAVYTSLSQATRQAHHERAAQMLERDWPQLCATQPQIVAQHWSAAGRWREAIAYWRTASRRALEQSDPVAAATHVVKQLEALEHVLDISAHAQHDLTFQTTFGAGLSTIMAQTPQDKAQSYARARALCPLSHDTPQALQVLQGLWSLYLEQGAFATARDLGEACLKVAHRTPRPSHLLRAHHAMGVALSLQGALTDARDHLERAFTSYDIELNDLDGSACGLGVSCLAYLAKTLWLLGYSDQALQRMHAARALAQDLAHPLSQICALVWAAELHCDRREVQATQACADAAVTLASDYGMDHLAAQGMVLAGWARYESGHKEVGLAQLRRALSTYPTSGGARERPRWLTLWAEVLAKGGEAQASLAALDEAMALTQRNRGSHYLAAELCRLKGEGLLFQTEASTAFEEAERCFEQARVVARRQQARSLERRAALSLGRLWHQQGKQDEARHLLTTCQAEFVEGFDTTEFKAVQAFLQTLH